MTENLSEPEFAIYEADQSAYVRLKAENCFLEARLAIDRLKAENCLLEARVSIAERDLAFRTQCLLVVVIFSLLILALHFVRPA